MISDITIIDNNITFSPLVFYNDFLQKLADYYSQNPSHEISFRLFENGNEYSHDSSYRIDPIAIPLLLSIIEQLSKYHQKPLYIQLNNNQSNINALGFLYRSGFFRIKDHQVGDLISSEILSYDKRFLGAFNDQLIRKDHVVRSYNKDSFSLDYSSPSNYQDEVFLRDQILSHVSYRVQENYAELLFDNEFTQESHNLYIDILSELITNGVLHSGSTTYAMMFVDRYKCKFSISDNGIGLKQSLNNKNDDNFYYKNGEFASVIKLENKSLNNIFIDNVICIFETLYYSSLKERRGLFDLMANVVLGSNGYFRLHTDNCQIVMSNRIYKYINQLYLHRELIFELHKLFELKKIETDVYKNELLKLAADIKNLFKLLLEKTMEYYSEEAQYSAVRFFKVRFRGVHIEVEIPSE